MVGDLDDHKISSVPNFNSVQNLRPLGSVEAYNFYNGIVSCRKLRQRGQMSALTCCDGVHVDKLKITRLYSVIFEFYSLVKVYIWGNIS